MSSFVMHIGYPKTATTSLQRHWFPRARDVGYFYAAISGGLDNHVANPAKRFADHCWGKRYELVPEIVSANKVLLSSEEFLSSCIRQVSGNGEFNPFPVEKLAGLLHSSAKLHGFSSPKVVICLRKQLDLMHSMYAQAYMHWFRKFDYLNTFPRFLDYVQSNNEYAKVFDYDAVVWSFINYFGTEAVTVLFYEDLFLNPGSFREKIEALLGVNLPHDLPRLNKRLDSSGARYSQPYSFFTALSSTKKKSFFLESHLD